MARALAVLSALTTAGVLFWAVPPVNAAPKMCANTYGGDVISANGVRCSKARDVVRTWAVRYRRDGVVNRRVLRFRCKGSTNRFEGLVMRCRRPSDGATVRFYANVPR
jgi:hypothetical protein